MPRLRLDPPRSEDEAPEVEVVIEVPRGSFLKRGATGRVDFVSPLPCPFNYGSLPALPAPDGDAQDAVLLGPRRAAGQRVHVPVRGVIGFLDAGQADDKLICAERALSLTDQRRVLAFFRFYALCKRLLNVARLPPS